MIKHVLILFLLLVLLPNIPKAQVNVDSLLRVADQTALPDSSRLQALYDLSFHYTYSQPDSAQLLAEQHLELARAVRDTAAQGRSLYLLGWLQNTAGDYDASLNAFQRGLQLSRAAKDSTGAARTLNGIGAVLMFQGEYGQALDYYKQTLDIVKAQGNRSGEASIISNIGIISFYQGDYASALDYQQQALEIRKNLDDKPGVANTLSFMGNNYLYQGDYPKAQEAHQKALELYKELDDQRGVANELGNIGIIYANRGDHARALDYYQQSLKLKKSLADKRGMGSTLNNIGNIYIDQGEYSQALDYLEQSLEIKEDLGDQAGMALTMSNIATCYAPLGQDSLALDYGQRGLALARQVGAKMYESNAQNVLGGIYLELGQNQLARQAYREALALGEEVGDVEYRATALSGLAQLASMDENWLQARNYARRGLDLAQEGDVAYAIRDAAEVLWQSQRALGQPAAALESYQTFVQMRDSLQSAENQRATLNFEYQQKALQDSLAFVQQQAQTQVTFEQQLARRNYLLFGGLGATLLLGLGWFFWQQRRNRERELAQQLERAERLEQIDKLKDQFLANTSHELRTPLNGIIGLSEGLLDKEADPGKQENLSMIVSSGKRLASLVNDILDFSKLRTHEIELRQKPVDLKSLVKLVLRIHQPLVEGKDLQLINELPDDLPPLLADEDRLQQILFNLVGNATKFTETGHVKLSAETREGHLEIAVEDTGIGIPENQQEAIFQAFEQGDGSIQREFAGTGLGLSISKQLVELHGGNMRVDSEVGQGATFYFTLPLAAAPLRDAGITAGAAPARTFPILNRASKAASNEAKPAKPVAYPNDERLRILVVDDEPINQQVIKNHLPENRFELVQAMNGEEALQIIENDRRLDLVLLDVMMPRMSGYEVCQRIREQYLPSELPVIMVTAKNQVADLVQGLGLGANDYLAKPFTKDEFLARIKTHLSLHRINKVTNRFVPAEFIRALGKNTLTEISLGDQVQREVTVLFTDIRNYTGLAEQMSPKENFRFVNAYAGRMGPIINQHLGFVNQYLGDGIMAIFQRSPDDALQASIGMQREVRAYNESRQQQHRQSIRVGMGMHTGPLIMGIIGDDKRTDAATISDTVNTAARMETLTKQVGANILLTDNCLRELSDPQRYHLRYLGRVRIKGREAPVGVYECFDCDPESVQSLKKQWMSTFDEAVTYYTEQSFSQAIVRFEEILAANPSDQVAANLLEESKQYLTHGDPEAWVG